MCKSTNEGIMCKSTHCPLLTCCRYREALEPNNLCGSQRSDRAGAYADGQVEACTENDMCMMREFMAFVVTRLQVNVP